MAKKESQASQIEDLKLQLARKDAALDQARRGLFKIGNIDPITFNKTRGFPKPTGLGIVKAFQQAQEIADEAVMNMSDAEAPDGVV